MLKRPLLTCKICNQINGKSLVIHKYFFNRPEVRTALGIRPSSEKMLKIQTVCLTFLLGMKQLVLRQNKTVEREYVVCSRSDIIRGLCAGLESPCAFFRDQLLLPELQNIL